MHPDTEFSARVAPPMIGLGLLESIPDKTLLAWADEQDTNKDGISGKVNKVWDIEKTISQLVDLAGKQGNRRSCNKTPLHLTAMWV